MNEESEETAPLFTATFFNFPDAGDVLLAEEETLHEMIGDMIYYEGGIDGEAPFEYQGVRLYDVAEITANRDLVYSFGFVRVKTISINAYSDIVSILQ